jgi:hypothetical protein
MLFFELLVGARGRRPLWSPPWVPMTFGRQCEVLEVLFFLIFYSLFGPCPARLALPPAPPCPAPCPALPGNLPPAPPRPVWPPVLPNPVFQNPVFSGPGPWVPLPCPLPPCLARPCLAARSRNPTGRAGSRFRNPTVRAGSAASLKCGTVASDGHMHGQTCCNYI